MSSTVTSNGPGDLPRPGELLAEKYRVEGVLGEGGMGVVLKAHHLHLDEPVAIKLLQPSVAANPTLVARFLREGRASIKIRSEHVVKVLDVATLPSGAPYMVMELLQGTDLAGLLEKQGPLTLSLAVDYLLQAMEAIAEAHALGLVHRDLKPANLFLAHRADGSPCVKVLDFGIYNEAQKEGVASMTRTHAVMGSPLYMSPEQMRSTRAVDARTDIWALGVIVQELLTGAPPFSAETMPELLAIILQDPPPPIAAKRADVPPAFDLVVQRCLAKDPAQRFADVGELAMALAPFGSPAAKASAERIVRVLRSASNANAQSAPATGAKTTLEAPWMPPSATPPSSTVQSGYVPAQAPKSSTQASWAETGPAPRPSRSPALWIALGLLGAGIVAAALIYRSSGSSVQASASPGPVATTPAIESAAVAVPAPAPTPIAETEAPASAAASAVNAKPTAGRSKAVAAQSTAIPPASAKPPADLFDGRK